MGITAPGDETMTRDEILALQPSEELDRMVAETFEKQPQGPPCGSNILVYTFWYWNFTTNQ